jgi:hypothetical protein
MTEAEWLACTDPTPMLEFVRSKRKMRLYATSCCRRLLPLFSDLSLSGVVEAAERFADGQIGRRRLRAIWNPFFHQSVPYSYFSPQWHARGAVVAMILSYCLKHRPRREPMNAVISAVVEATCKWWNLWRRREARTAERKVQCDLLRDIVGNSFESTTLDPSLLTPTVTKTAQSIYQERTFDRMPILAESLEQAGCTNFGILNHCRLPRVHVRGCWVVDQVLGKE